MTQLCESVLKVIAYFDMFHYPITMEEIHQFLDQPLSDGELEMAVRQLLNKQAIWQLDRFYSLRNDQHLAERRVKGNKLAVRELKYATKVARIIFRYPFVRGIAISGSLSKNFAYEDSDFDFFIITAPNRLWIARVFLLMTARILFTIGLRRICCLNYYIDEKALEIEERNIFTAVEIVTLLPVQGNECFRRFFAANQWTGKYLPNSGYRRMQGREPVFLPLKRCIEWLMDNRFGSSVDNYLMKLFRRHWDKLLLRNKLAKDGVPMGAVMSGKHMCKPDSRYFQQKMLNNYREKLADVKARYPKTV